jgi:NADH-quinone oxidoreductase subunit L
MADVSEAISYTIIENSTLTTATWLIILVPIISSFFLTALRYYEVRKGKKIEHPPLYTILFGVGSLFISLILTLWVFVSYFTGPYVDEYQTIEHSYTMIPGTRFEYGIMLDPLSMLMTLALAVIATAIHVYAIEYMKHHEPEVTRFYAFMNFFTGSMFGFILSNNLFHSFIFWELLGVSSYFLIGHYWQKPEAASAAKKAFLYNKVGDVMFLFAIFMALINQTGPMATRTLNYTELRVISSTFDQLGLALIAVFLFGAAIGKSSQFPLFGWLPEAMEGPTPVSALLHSSTMVKAGLYLILRGFFFIFNQDLYGRAFELAQQDYLFLLAPDIIAWVGIITALMGALMASVSFDFKRILAFSTISQLGYIAVAVGAGGKAAGFFHLLSHATFKSLLFLCAGAVIHNTYNTKDIRNMGDLARHMKVTFAATAIGLFALSGFPFISSGFYSKDAVLLSVEKSALTGHMGIFIIGIFTAFITAFYSVRLLLLVFYGKPRFDKNKVIPHESSAVMKYPLIFLGSLVVIQSIYWAISTLAGAHWFFSEHWFADVLGVAGHDFSISKALISTGVVLAGYAVGYMFYKNPNNVEKTIWGPFQSVIEKRFYLDISIYWTVDHIFIPIGDIFKEYGDRTIDRFVIDRIFRDGTLQAADFSDKVDQRGIDGVVNGSWKFFVRFAKLLRPIQNGLTGSYARYMIVGIVVILMAFNIYNMITTTPLF